MSRRARAGRTGRGADERTPACRARFRGARTALAALALAAALACATARPPTVTTAPVPLDPAAGSGEVARHGQAFHALQAAMQAGDDHLARSIWARLDATVLSAGERSLLDGLGDVLQGRALVAALHARLAFEAGGQPGHWLVTLFLRQDGPATVEAHLPPGRLVQNRQRIDAKGVQSSELRTHVVDRFADLALPPGEEVRVPLLEHTVPMHGALAMRDEWRLELLSGTLIVDGHTYPAGGFARPTLERTYLADFLPRAAVDPDVLVEYARSEDPATAPLVERAVRIAPANRDEALDRLLPVVEELARDDPGRVAAIAPALSWLARTDEPGVDAEAWLRFLRAHRAAVAAQDEPQPRERLVLPPTGASDSGDRAR